MHYGPEMKVGVVGAGAWGTALALVTSRAGFSTCLWTRNKDQALEITAQQTNAKALPGITFDTPLQATTEPDFLQACAVIILATPAQTTRDILQTLKSYFSKGTVLILTAKGIEHSTGALMSEVLTATCPEFPFAILSGPTFAKDVALNLPTAVTLASLESLEPLLKLFATHTFRPYGTDDIIGVQVGGAVKNVLAIASGIVAGRGLGDNAQAALITRGLSELVRLGLAKGGKLETFLGLSGCGDVVLTCTSRQSRNMMYGVELSQNTQREGILREGFFTAQTIMSLADQLNVDMPICYSIHNIVTGKSTIDAELQKLLLRPLKLESSLFSHKNSARDQASLKI